MKKLLIGALASAAMAAGGIATPAFASDGVLNVKLNVNTACDINGKSGVGTGTGAASELTFSGPGAGGVYAAPGSGTTPVTTSSTATSGTGAMTVTCSGATTPSVAFDGGLHASSGVRNMQTSSSIATVPALAYTLGSTAGTPTDYAISTPVSLGAFTPGQAKTIQIWGAVPGGVPTGADGSYTDTVGITLTW